MKTCIIGLGYIGLPTAALMGSRGLDVHGVDINQEVVNTVNRGAIHIIEPGLEDMVKKAVAHGFLQASIEPAAAETYLVVVPTPFKGNNEPDISYVAAACEKIAPLLKKDDLVIIESTSPVGTTEKMSRLISRLRPDLMSEESAIHMAYCPERVLPGNVMHELENNDRVIGGMTAKATEKACSFYRQFVSGELHTTNARTAEMCKLTENASRDAQIAFANELSLICDKADIDVWELIRLANKHPRVNILQPGCGVGGHCIAVDPWFIVSDYPLESRMIGTAREINNHKAFWCAEKIQQTIQDFEVKKGRQPVVALMGLAFKPNIDDLRESPAKYIVMKTLQHDDKADLHIVEPNITEHKIFKISDYQTAFEAADIVAFLVAHKEFKTLPKDDSKIVLDFCGVIQ